MKFLHVQDLANCIEFISDLDIQHSLLNVGSGNEVTILELANLIKEVVEFKGELIFDSSKPDGNPRKLLDSSKINSIGWKPEITLEEGLKSTYNWFRNNV